TGEILKECIESIFRFEKNTNFEIIIVDNNSTDNSQMIIEDLENLHKEIKHIFLNELKSFSYANNTGFYDSEGTHILIMNPDIIFTDAILEKLLKSFDDVNDLGAVCPLLIGTDGKFQRRYFQRYPSLFQFIFFYSMAAKFFLRFPKLINRYFENGDIDIKGKRLQYVEQIPCAFFLTKRSVFESVGMMDDSYVLFFEDVDLSYKINSNYKIAVDVFISIKHLGGSSFKTSDDYWLYGRFILSMIKFFENNYSAVRTFLLRLLTLVNSHSILFLEFIKKVFGKGNNYRARKHKYFLKEYKKIY
ncbi:MAG: glycosyltransferase, partial [bacterium]